jgi:hypothetical protein
MTLLSFPSGNYRTESSMRTGNTDSFHILLISSQYMLHTNSQGRRKSRKRKGTGKYMKRIKQNDTLLLNIFSPYQFLLGSLNKER